ncbi:hypothetical protein [Pseudomonas atagonensis]|uniref:hypothetical protein n=1 Tax=Pseudomonas atagonensis TaxID=2609964 RepID=UPI00140E48C4|nr:hypothetical protein [Pseudomonas atagonensis]
MTTSTPPNNTVLALAPPYVNGQTYPVEGADIGVPKVAVGPAPDGKTFEAGLPKVDVELGSDGKILVVSVTVDPPISGTMDPGDVMHLWLKGEPAALDFKIIVDPNVRTLLHIPEGRLHPDLLNLLYYTVTRGSTNIGTLDPPLSMLYNRIRPGLKDRLTVPGGHSELKLLLPDEIRNGVGKDFVSAQVRVSYPYCRAYDTITLKCNGEFLEPKPRVSPTQAPPPPNPGSEEPTTFCFTITRAFLDKAKRQNNKLDFSYTVTDQLLNGPDPDAPWSAVHTVDEDLDGKRLPMPILLERKEDYPGDNAEEIDLAKLAGGPLLLVVLTADSRFVVGYEVIATYTCKVPGQPDIEVIVKGKVEADPFGAKKTLFLEVPNDKVLERGAVTVVYELRDTTGKPVATSGTAKATVVGTRIEPKAPAIKEAPNGVSLVPNAAKSALTAIVNYVGMKLGDKIIVTWKGAAGTPAGGSHTAPEKTVTVLGPQEIPLANSVVAFNLNESVSVSYAVQQGSQKPQPSQTLVLAVLALILDLSNVPKFLQAANNGDGAEFDVSKLTANAILRAFDWPLIALLQRVWLRLFGTNDDNTPYERTIWNGGGAQTNKNWINNRYYDTAALKSELQGLKNGSLLRIEFKAGLKGSLFESDAVTFTERAYTIKAVEDLKPTIDSIKGLPSNIEIPPGGITVETRVILTGIAAKGQKVDVLLGTVSKGQPVADPTTGRWTQEVTGLTVALHSFTVEALYGSGQTSDPRTLTVVSELIVDTSDLFLSGANISIAGTDLPWTRISDPAGTSANRAATGGTSPYKYKSDDKLVATVDENGVVRSTGNGTTTITVEDKAGQTKSFKVTTSNVRRLITTYPNSLTFTAFLQWVSTANAQHCTRSEGEVAAFAQALSAIFQPTLPPGDTYHPQYFICATVSPRGSVVKMHTGWVGTPLIPIFQGPSFNAYSPPTLNPTYKGLAFAP